ncbi:MAG TPA: putative 2-aminoethylphosphonate ABC transporter ATP-binding protein [Hyphomicrobiaceae bacterium]|jgi:iron(III) transport system ATP-binding protein
MEVQPHVTPVPSPRETAPAAARPIHLRVQGITKRFGAFTALDDVSLEVESGRLVCFLGPSGCGKTTLLRVIAGLEMQDTGNVEIGGRDVTRLPPAQRDFGIVFQSYALFPNLTAAQNVGYGLVNRRKARAEIAKRVAELLSLVGMPEQGAKYPSQLSGGQQQRVALARALASSPSLLLLDEPLSALDARVRVRLRDEIKALQRRLGITTVMVTHDQEEALAMADRIVVMNRGRVEQVGSPAEIYARPATAFVAHFVGAMNILDAVVAGPGRAQAGSLALACDALGQRAEGHRVRLGLRPEEVRIRGIEPGAPNAVLVTVVLLDFLGAFCRATLRPTAGGDLTILCDFSANAMRDLGIREGQALTVALPPDLLRVFDNGGSPDA